MIGIELLASAGLVVMIDQLSKRIILNRLAEGPYPSGRFPVRIKRSIHVKRSLRLARNRLMLVLLWCFIVLSILFLVCYSSSFQSHIAQIGLGVALGGASGNFYDMLWHRAIVNFIDVDVWPVFNLADAAIVLGVVTVLWFA